MSTTIRPELSKDNPYYISKHRYYELKHFCLQYDELKKEREQLLNESAKSGWWEKFRVEWSDTTSSRAARCESLMKRIKMIEDCAKLTDPVLSNYILRGVTLGESYDVLRTKCDIPCGRDYYYELYHKFFWILDLKRQ